MLQFASKHVYVRISIESRTNPNREHKSSKKSLYLYHYSFTQLFIYLINGNVCRKKERLPLPQKLPLHETTATTITTT